MISICYKSKCQQGINELSNLPSSENKNQNIIDERVIGVHLRQEANKKLGIDKMI